MSKKETIEKYVKKFEEAGYEVFGVENGYGSRKTFVHIKDKNGYKYRKNIFNILLENMGNAKFDTRNPFFIENLQLETSRKNDNVEVLEYLGGKKIKINCKKHGEFVVSKDVLYVESSHVCPKCGDEISRINHRISEREMIKLCEDRNCEYVGHFIKKPRGEVYIKFICNKHRDKGVQSKSAYDMKHNKFSCIYCSNIYARTTEEFKEELRGIDDTIEVIGEYVNCRTPILCKCKRCNVSWSPTPSNLKSGMGCPNCHPSKGEKRIFDFLEKNSIKFETQKRFIDLKGVKGGSLSYDFYLEDHSLFIEFQGIQHYKPTYVGIISLEEATEIFEKQKKNDNIKREYAKENGYKLLEIKYDEYDNIEEILEKELHIKNIA